MIPGMGLLKAPPHDPAKHEHQELTGAGLGWWAKEIAKLSALMALHGELLDGPQAAAFLCVSRQRMCDLGTAKMVRRFKLGRHSFYPLKDLQAWKDRERVTGRGNRVHPVFTDSEQASSA